MMSPIEFYLPGTYPPGTCTKNINDKRVPGRIIMLGMKGIDAWVTGYSLYL